MATLHPASPFCHTHSPRNLFMPPLSACQKQVTRPLSFFVSLQTHRIDGFPSWPCMFILVNYSTYSVWSKLISTAIQLLLHLQHIYLLKQINSAMQHHLSFSSASAQTFYSDKTILLPLTPPHFLPQLMLLGHNIVLFLGSKKNIFKKLINSVNLKTILHFPNLLHLICSYLIFTDIHYLTPKHMGCNISNPKKKRRDLNGTILKAGNEK